MSLVQMSIYGGVMILFITLLRALFLERLPKRTFLALWGVAAVRLLVPFKLPSVFSLYTLLARVRPYQAPVSTQITQDAPASNASATTIISATVESAAASGTASATAEVIASVPVWNIVWAVGAIICAVCFAVAYRRSLREFCTSLPVQNDAAARWLQEHPLKRPLSIRQSDRIDAPLTYGVFRPVILMPKHTDWADTETLQYVLAHEYTHVRRFDNLAKLILAATLCLHWFNPLVWVMYVLANRDMELSCDEAVVRSFGIDFRAGYAQALIRMEEHRSRFAPLYSSFSKNAIEERIVSIMKTRKPSAAARLAACVLVAGLAVACGTTPASSTSTSPDGTASTDVISTSLPPAAGFTVTPSTDDNGRLCYQVSDCTTVQTMSQEEYRDQYAPNIDAEWWTYDELEQWIAGQRKEMEALIGTGSGWYDGNGTFHEWTQDTIDEALGPYEGMLTRIKSGQFISKPIENADGSQLQYTYSPSGEYTVISAYEFTATLNDGTERHFGPCDTPEELYALVESFCTEQVQLGTMTQAEADRILASSRFDSLPYTGTAHHKDDHSSHHS